MLRAVASVAFVMLLCATSASCTSAAKPEQPASSAVELVVASDGQPHALILEWTGGPSIATGWQYRMRTWDKDADGNWHTWTDIPGMPPPAATASPDYTLQDHSPVPAVGFRPTARAGGLPRWRYAESCFSWSA